MIISIFGNNEYNNDEPFGISELSHKIKSFLERNVGDEITLIYIARFSDFGYSVSNMCMEFKKAHTNVFVYLVSGTKCKKLMEYEPYSTLCCNDIYLGLKDENGMNFRDLWMLRQSDIAVTCYQNEDEDANNVFEYLIKNKKQYVNLGDYELKQIRIK